MHYNVSSKLVTNICSHNLNSTTYKIHSPKTESLQCHCFLTSQITLILETIKNVLVACKSYIRVRISEEFCVLFEMVLMVYLLRFLRTMPNARISLTVFLLGIILILYLN